MSNRCYLESLFSSQQKLKIKAQQIRSVIPTPGEIGTEIEDIFKSNLKEVLPERIGISRGFVMDSNGGQSKQMDIILYNRINTPRIFTSNAVQVFPVESTYACGEVKTKLDKEKLNDSFNKCQSYKNLTRTAYFDQSESDFYFTHKLYGTETRQWKSIFFILSVESISSSELIEEYKRIVKENSFPMEKRVDSIFSLKSTDNGNVICHYSDDSYDFLPSENSHLHGVFVERSWAFFLNMLLRYMVETRSEPINMLEYGGKSLCDYGIIDERNEY